MTNTTTIARNAGWYGIDNLVSFIVTLFTSIAIARTLGPSKNGYIVYVSYIAGVISSLGGLGIPAATRKYMAEFIGMGDKGTAKYIYSRTLMLQAGLATLTTGGLLVWVLGYPHTEYFTHPEYKLASALLVLSVWPAMTNSISSMANAATEDLATNLPASIVSTLAYFVAITATIVFKGGVVGVGASMLIMRLVDFLVRLFPTMKRVAAWEITHISPPGLRKRMISFAWQSVASTIVALIVWSRSEVILLKSLCADIRQVSYYSIAFTMADQLLLGAAIFGSASGTTIFAQVGRDKSSLPRISASVFRYLALMSIPLHFIFSALAVPALLLVYGSQYAGAAMVVMLAPILCMSKAFISPAQSLLQSMERQGYVIAATIVAGIVDISVAWFLIPAHGAVGACIGNGAAQLTAVGLMWAAAIYLYKVKLPWLQTSKILFASLLAALTAHYCAKQFITPLWSLLVGGCAALIVLFGLFYIMRVLEEEDHDRFKLLAEMLPRKMTAPVHLALGLLIRP